MKFPRTAQNEASRYKTTLIFQKSETCLNKEKNQYSWMKHITLLQSEYFQINIDFTFNVGFIFDFRILT